MSIDARLRRTVGLPGAILLGLGSMLGTGVFVSLGFAAEAAGPSALLAIALAGLLAAANAMSSARLAAAHPVAGGTYEYGHRYLNPALGFTAGWLFLCAKTASAAAAAMALSAYAFTLAGIEWPHATRAGAAIALLAVVLVGGGVRRSNRANAVLVAITLAALGVFAAAGFRMAASEPHPLAPFFDPVGGGSPAFGFLRAVALAFVAYTGYARIATLGEEVHDPARVIPRAILLTVGICAIVFLAVAGATLFAVGATDYAAQTRETAAPLEQIASGWGIPGLVPLLAAGALSALFGVLLNLILGLSRVVLAMARRGDLPAAAARLDASRTTPKIAVLAAGLPVILLALFGSVASAWSFSAFTVLLYYAITHLAALRLPRLDGLARGATVLGLTGCAGLAFFVEPAIWLVGLAILGTGHLLRAGIRRILRNR